MVLSRIPVKSIVQMVTLATFTCPKSLRPITIANSEHEGTQIYYVHQGGKSIASLAQLLFAL